jgi:hypothetical protein
MDSTPKPNSTEQIALAIIELGAIRNIPQYYFCSGITYPNSFKLREQIITFKQENPNCEEIDFILFSSGGIADAAYLIIRSLRHHFKNVNIIIPFFAKSAATLLALGGTKIIMDEFGEFGPIDVQIPVEKDDNPVDYDDRESALIDEISLENIEARSHKQFHRMFVSIFENTEIPVNKNDLTNSLLGYLSDFYKPLLSQIKTYQIGEKNRKLDIGYKYAHRILTQYSKIQENRRSDLVQYLVHDCPHHGYIIDYVLIKAFLPNVVVLSSEISDDYKNKLQDLSLLLIRNTISNELRDFTGFIKQPVATPKATPKEKPNKSKVLKINKKTNALNTLIPTKKQANGEKVS